MPPRFQPVVPSVHLSDRVAEALAAEIRSGRWVAGDRLPTEAVLVKQFAVSRTVVREAVSRLKSLGLLESQQGSGVYVREAGFSPLQFDAQTLASQQAVVQMAEVRRGLEAEAAALAAERRTAPELAAIEAAVASIAQAVAAGGDGVDDDVRFHQAIASAAHNPFLNSTLDYLRQFLRGAVQVTRANEARRADFARQVAQEHAAIVRAIALGDATAARRAASRHMSNAIVRIRQADPAFWQQEGGLLADALVAAVRQP
jgi:GntR family transcriptional regulator, transcriptional repressor for pyruvate dehydrogenase complex